MLDHGYAKLVLHYGSDEFIVESARQSTDGAFRGWPQDERLIDYMASNGHHSPFEFAGACFEVQAPVFVAREWQRHRTQSVSEMSQRYVKSSMPDYVPSAERMREKSAKNRQAGVETSAEPNTDELTRLLREHMAECQRLYEQMLASGVSREVARVVLPTARFTRFRAMANLRNWAHWYKLRVESSAQYEIRVYAEAVGAALAEKFPRSWGKLVNV